ncbi:MAG: sugar ABC transporter permease [Candidatus Izemoplasmatales bacterium]|nr:sugar ABC transporter permease [Candidatus Izemoplasmatales bacterium]
MASTKRKVYFDTELKGVKKLLKPLIIFLILIGRWFKDFIYSIEVMIHRIFKRSNDKPKNLGAKRRGELIFFIALIAYPILQFFVFYIIVNINSLMLAFQEFDPATASFHFKGFQNFALFLRDISQDPQMKQAAINSLTLYLSTLFIALPLNLMFSYFLYKKVVGKGIFRVVLFLPQIISALVVSLMFRYFVENAISQIIGFNLLQTRSTGFPTIIFYTIWASFGTQILIYTSAMSRIDPALVEYGKLEGMSMLQEFWHITLPSIFPTITVFLVVGVAGLFTNQASLFNFYGPSARGDLQTIGYVFFVKVIRNTDASFAQYPYASAAGILFTLVAAPVTLLAKNLLEKYGPSVD